MMTSIVLGLMLLSPMMTASVKATAPEATIDSQIPAHAAKVHDEITNQLKTHPDWIGMMKWDQNGATIEYLGPQDSNKFKAPDSIKSQLQLSPAGPINTGRAPTKDTTASGTAIYKEVSDFTTKASTTTGVNLFQILNALSSDKSHWIQGGVFYDKAGLLGTPSWRFDIDSWATTTAANCNEDSGVPVISSALNMAAGDSVEEYIYQQSGSPGQYNIGITDITKNNGYVISKTYSGDSGSTINLGQVTCTDSGGAQYVYASGPEVEEHDSAAASHTYNFSTIAYTEGYYDTSTSSKTTSVTGWQSTWGCGATNSATNSPASITFTFQGAC